jgi:alpha/beta superfamily hydrolase
MTHHFDSQRPSREHHPQAGVYKDRELLLEGAAGRIEAVTAYPQEFQDGDPISVICHPHPLYGGSMDNKVVYMISRAFEELGAATLRFNFRGVGKTQGRYDEGKGEAGDLQALVEWFCGRHPGSPLWLAGFSFGAYVAARACPDIAPERLLLVAPPVTMFDFASLPPIEVPYLVVQGGEDDIIQPQAVDRWVEAQPEHPLYQRLADAGHFFHGRLNRLRDAIIHSWG